MLIKPAERNRFFTMCSTPKDVFAIERDGIFQIAIDVYGKLDAVNGNLGPVNGNLGAMKKIPHSGDKASLDRCG